MAGAESVQFDFSQPWRMSDAVLLVEEDRLHVHQGILAMWSPVFEEMFSELRKKNTRVLILENVRSGDVREMLLFIYPTIHRPITEANCYCLLDLANRFQMSKVTEECENYLMGTLGSGSEVIDMLVLAGKYNVKRLREESLQRAKRLDWKTIQEHALYEQIALPDYRYIAEYCLKKLQMELVNEKERVQMLEDEVDSLLPRGTIKSSQPARKTSPPPAVSTYQASQQVTAKKTSPVMQPSISQLTQRVEDELDSLFMRESPLNRSAPTKVITYRPPSPPQTKQTSPEPRLSPYRPSSPTKHLQVTLQSRAAHSIRAPDIPADAKTPPPVPKRSHSPVRPPVVKEF